jgi:hypothetical protein
MPLDHSETRRSRLTLSKRLEREILDATEELQNARRGKD